MFFKYRKDNRQQRERLQAQTKTRCRFIFMPPCPSGHPYAQGAEEPTSTALSIKCLIYFVALVIRYLIFLFTRRLNHPFLVCCVIALAFVRCPKDNERKGKLSERGTKCQEEKEIIFLLCICNDLEAPTVIEPAATPSATGFPLV